MSYPPPPGSHTSSLPPRPPPSKVSGFKPAFASATPPTHTPSPGGRTPYAAPAAPPAYSSAPSYAGASAPYHYGALPTTTYPSYTQAGVPVTAGGYPPQANAYQPCPQQGGHAPPPNYYGAAGTAAAGGGVGGAPSTSSYAAAPQIRNPFPAPSQPKSDDYDPEMAAQIAQWQSAYVKDPKDNTTPAAPGGRPGATNANGMTTYATDASRALEANNAASAAAAAAAAGPVGAEGTEKKKTVVRVGGGQKWTDDSLLEWDPSHLRLFVGNLAGETTDESLYKAFARWRSLQKARVIRDKVTSKSRGYGFVSFSDPDEFFAAAKEMNGKYIQSHPVVVRKSTTEIKPTAVKDKHANNKWNKNKNKNNKNKNRSGNGSGGGGGREGSFEPNLGPAGGGVFKPGQKTKGGLKLLG
ncbi:hypothetical protein F5B20DRAFT_412226 [Whalleya microplaca]|nr:hypothetical protein F5B20DRAFT_412226 [Whalleya microplaca]